MAYFVPRLQPPRSRFPQDGTAREMAALQRHSDDLRQVAAAKTAAAVRPMLDGEGSWGSVIVDVKHGQEVQVLVDDDSLRHADPRFRQDLLTIPPLILRPHPAVNAGLSSQAHQDLKHGH
ncbi:hypothetical protein [Oryzifoliimicrobium ureilyticus]|uniref:hypothetical protein n=1 Tax=Oryzifoliimicrobium ureilyticus TaxID=3113724 RepID=UPI003075FFC2